MCNVEDLYVGQTLMLQWKHGKKTKDNKFSIISKAPDGKVALLEIDDEKTPMVTDGSVWICKVTMIFEHKIVVRAIEETTQEASNDIVE